jgi:hypothetical protein
MQNATSVGQLTTPQLTMINNLLTCATILFAIISAMARKTLVPHITKVMLNSLHPNDFHGLRSDLLELILNPKKEAEPRQETIALRRTPRRLNTETGFPTDREHATTS